MSNLPLVDAIRVLALFSGRTDLLVSGEQPLRPRNSEFAIETLRSAYAEETDSTFRMRCCRILLRTARDSRDRRRLQRAMNITESLIDVEQTLNKRTTGGGKGGPSFEEYFGDGSAFGVSITRGKDEAAPVGEASATS